MKIKNLRYVEETNTLINMDVTLCEKTANQYHKAGETIPFTLHPDDKSPVAVAALGIIKATKPKIAPYRSN